VKNLFFLIADRIVLPGSFAVEGHTHVYTNGQTHGAALAGLLTLVAGLTVGFVLFKSGWTVRIFVIFCFGTTALSLLFPLASGGDTNPWTVLATTGSGDRYFFSAEVAWLVCVIWALSRVRVPALKWGAGLLLGALFVSGLVASPQYTPFADDHPALYDAQLRAALPGTVIDIPLNPPGSTWSMELTRRR
jgi:hypothetical protein